MRILPERRHRRDLAALAAFLHHIRTGDERAELDELAPADRQRLTLAAGVALALVDEDGPDRFTAACYVAADQVQPLAAQTPLGARGLVGLVRGILLRSLEVLAGERRAELERLRPVIARIEQEPPCLVAGDRSTPSA